jgi:hypothetical protein
MKSIPNIRVNESREPFEIYLRWIIANHSKGRRTPDLANLILNQVSNDSFQPSQEFAFHDLWESHGNRKEFDSQCDKEASRLNAILAQCEVDLFLLSDQKPSSGFDSLAKVNLLSCQGDILAILLLTIERLQNSVRRLERRLKSIEDANARDFN